MARRLADRVAHLGPHPGRDGRRARRDRGLGHVDGPCRMGSRRRSLDDAVEPSTVISRSTRRGATRSPSRSSGPACSWRSRSPGSCAAERAPFRADLYLGTMGLLVAGAIAWGCAARRLHDVLSVLCRDRRLCDAGRGGRRPGPCGSASVTARRSSVAGALSSSASIQLELGSCSGIVRLQGFGPHVRADPGQHAGGDQRAPADAKLAYSCRPFEEVAFGTPRLLSIDAHTEPPGRADVLRGRNPQHPDRCRQRSDQVANLFFRCAPQTGAISGCEARPSSSDVAAFLKAHGIDYIYCRPQTPPPSVSRCPLPWPIRRRRLAVRHRSPEPAVPCACRPGCSTASCGVPRDGWPADTLAGDTSSPSAWGRATS